MKKPSININKDDTIADIKYKAWRKLCEHNTVVLCCFDKENSLVDVLHALRCKARKHKWDVLMGVNKYRTSMNKTLVEAEYYLCRGGHINNNPFELEE